MKRHLIGIFLVCCFLSTSAYAEKDMVCDPIGLSTLKEIFRTPDSPYPNIGIVKYSFPCPIEPGYAGRAMLIASATAMGRVCARKYGDISIKVFTKLGIDSRKNFETVMYNFYRILYQIYKQKLLEKYLCLWDMEILKRAEKYYHLNIEDSFFPYSFFNGLNPLLDKDGFFHELHWFCSDLAGAGTPDTTGAPITKEYKNFLKFVIEGNLEKALNVIRNFDSPCVKNTKCEPYKREG